MDMIFHSARHGGRNISNFFLGEGAPQTSLGFSQKGPDHYHHLSSRAERPREILAPPLTASRSLSIYSDFQFKMRAR